MSNTLTPPSDVFTESMTHIAKGASKQRKLVFVASAIVVAVLAAFSVYISKKSGRIEAGKDSLFKARLLLESDLASVSAQLKPPAPKPLAKPDPKKPAPPEAPFSLEGVRFDVGSKLPQAIPALQEVARAYDGISPGFEAKIELANLYYQHGANAGDLTNAAQWFESAASNAPSTDNAVAALHGLGYAQEAMGKCDEAVKTFERALNYGNTLQQMDLLRAQARCYETLNNPAQAKTAYEKIVSLFPNSESARYAQNKLTVLK